MATSPKNPQADSDEAVGTIAAPASVSISISEFCMRLSESVIAPELIGAFAFTERLAGHVVDTQENFQAGYTAFINKTTD